jgi:hypothetical protein
MLEKLARWAVPGALLMAGAWFAAGIVAWALPGGQDLGDVGSTRFFLIEGLHSIGEFGLLAAIAGLYVFQRKSLRRLGKIGTWVAFVGTAILLASTLLWLAFAAAGGEGNLLTGLIFMAGILGWLVGFPILGIAMLRAGEMPVWTGVLVLIFIPVALGTHLALNSYGVGGVAVGLIWLAIGYGLWAQRTAPVYRQATV